MKKLMITSTAICLALILIGFGYGLAGKRDEVSIKVDGGTVFGELQHRGYDKIILIIAGSGPTDRDGNSDMIDGRNDSLKSLAHELGSKGYSTFRYDKRSSGKSVNTFDDEPVDFGVMVDDANAVVDMLVAKGYKSIYLIGHSQGALIAEVLGIRPEVAKVVSLCGTIRPIGEVLSEQLRAADADTSEAADRILKQLETGEAVTDVPESLKVFFGGDNRYLMSWMAYDPLDYIEPIEDKLLFIYGGMDIQIRADEILHMNYENVTVIEEMNHVLKSVKTDRENTDSYISPIYPLNSELTEILAEFFN